jgi:polyphosphate kinase
MTVQTPVTQTSFGSWPAPRTVAEPTSVRGAEPFAALAPLEARLATAREPRIAPLVRLRALAGFGRDVDTLFALRAPAVRPRSPADRRVAVRARLRALVEEAYQRLAAEIAPALASKGTCLVRWGELDAGARAALEPILLHEVAPLLTPFTVDATHPFPAVASGALNLAILVHEPGVEGLRYVGIEVPPTLPRFLAIPRTSLRLPIEDLIGASLDALLPGLDVRCHHAFRVTRDGRPLRARPPRKPSPRTRPATRLELDRDAPAALRARLVRALGLTADDLDPIAGPLDLGALAHLARRRAQASDTKRPPAWLRLPDDPGR